MNILVTGGAGYIGAELVRKLAEMPSVSQVTVYDNLSTGNYGLFLPGANSFPSDKVKFVFGDLLDSRSLKKVIKDKDVVYHLAAQVGSPFENTHSHNYEQSNHWGTAELVYAIEESTTVKQLIYLSSTGVYGLSRGKTLTEESDVNPRTFYAVSKMRAEDHVRRLTKIKSVIYRCANVYGYSPASRFDSVINRFMFDAHFNGRISIHGSGKQSRSFIHIDKVTGVLADTLSSSIPSGVYNLGDKNFQVIDLIDYLKVIYPDLEFIFINQHLDLMDLTVDTTNQKLSQYIKIPVSDFQEELRLFKEKGFSF